MTRAGLIKHLEKKLSESGNDNPAFEAMCMAEEVLGMKRTELLLHGVETVDGDLLQRAELLARRRNDGEPLQYILGVWEFMSLEFFVGSGVLIPRPETEMLVETAIESIGKIADSVETPVVYDLCAGSGCIGISVARYCKSSRVFLIEKYDEAFDYLVRNIEKNGTKNAVAIKGDITEADSFNLPLADVILSNPPYIESDEIPTLQKEVGFEPITALDGGEDGLYFYRIICQSWIKKLKKGGVLAVECGDSQAEMIAKMFSEFSGDVHMKKDLSGIYRTVSLVKE